MPGATVVPAVHCKSGTAPTHIILTGLVPLNNNGDFPLPSGSFSALYLFSTPPLRSNCCKLTRTAIANTSPGKHLVVWRLAVDGEKQLIFYCGKPRSGVGQRHHNHNAPGLIRSGGFLIRRGLMAIVLDFSSSFI
jgi:hypothetical protein